MSLRKSVWSVRIRGTIALATALALSGCSPDERIPGSVEVESCETGEAAAEAGLETGDVVQAWHQGSANGDVASPFHLAQVEQELAPHGPVTLTVVRDEKRLLLEIATGRWAMATQPRFETRGARHRDDTANRPKDVAPTTSDEEWQTLSRSAMEADRPLDSAWFDIRTAVARARSGHVEDAETVLNTGASKIAEPQLLPTYWERAGAALLAAGQTGIAAGAFDRTVTILEDETPDSPAFAYALLQRCRADFRSCNERASRALELYGRTGATTIEVAEASGAVGVVAYYRSDLDAAESAYLRALTIARDTMPGSPTELNLLGNLGLVAMRRGDFESAGQLFREERDKAIRLGDDNRYLGYAANYLGLLAKNTGRYDEARLHYEQALRVFEKIRPDGLQVAGVLSNLGNIERRQGRLTIARSHHERALALRRQIAPDGAEVVSSLHNLGIVARRQGDLAAARQFYEQALALKRDYAPGSLWVASTLYELGVTSATEGDTDAAVDYLERALEIRRRVAPNSLDVAASLVALGRVEFHRRQVDMAESRWRQAIDIVEFKRPTEGEDAWFRARYRDCYFSLASLLVERGQHVEAWDILERDRALSLRTAIARRSSVPAEVPAELWHARARTAGRLARLEGRFARLDPVQNETSLRSLRDQIETLETEVERISTAISLASPALAMLERPTTLSLADLSRRLNPGTATLTFTVGEESTLVTATASGVGHQRAIRTDRIDIGEQELATRVQRFHAFIARGRLDDELDPAMIEQGARLFELLLAPVWETVRTAERLLVVPDGPLYELAFAALVLPGDGAPRFVGHALPLFTSPSASLAVELADRSERSAEDRVTVVAFGEPLYPDSAPTVLQHRLQPLPGSGIEIEAVRRIFGDDARVYRGPEASETNLRRNGQRVSIVHFAVHAHIDPETPMESALFFSQAAEPVGATSDGVVSAWDIVDGVGPDAEVVVLSSCSTARGQVVSGEGIIGIARAFHVAGARTLVASHWEIPDKATARLMTHFYERLAEGQSTVEALFNAQQTVAADPQFEHPYNWASFQIRGDWH